MSTASDRYQRAKVLFHRIRLLPVQQQKAAAETACGYDSGLLDEVLSLLRADAQAEADTSFLRDAPSFQSAGDVDPETLGRERGWRVLRELGRGGMGVVFLAERADGAYQQKVALKLLRLDALEGADAALRSRLERQILARLEHPNIARLLDGGTAANGAPYLVMEYVQGERIDRWCRAHGLGVAARLRLFLKVCEAVAHAHRNLVVHRDLKPDNILVTAEGEPKLLDFGIASQLEEGDQSATEGMRLLTPRYASPEQIRGEAVTTQSDVYSLGVVLYELMTGASPYGEAASEPRRLEDAVCTGITGRPSVQVLSGEAQRESSLVEAASVRRLSRRLRGDLDAIVLHCLRKAAHQRYDSVEALIADLRAHLDGRPVAARAGESGYRALRFAQRHWVSLATASGVLILSLVFVLQLANQLESVRRERDKANQVTRVLTELFRQADPGEARGRDIGVREVLEAGAKRIRSDLGGQPLLRAELLRTLATIQLELGDFEVARALAQESLDLHRNTPGGESGLGRAHLVLGHALREQEQVPAARAAMEAALAAARASGDDLLRVQAKAQLALLLGSQGDHARALAEHQAILTEARQHILAAGRASDSDASEGEAREWREVLARALHNQCTSLDNLGRTEDALASCNEAAAAKQALWSDDHPIHLSTLVRLAQLQATLGGPSAAIPIERELLATSERVYGADHVRVAITSLNLGVSLKMLGQLDEAAVLYRRALAIFESRLGSEHRHFLLTRNNLANLERQRARRLEQAGELEQARAIHREVLAIHEEVLAARRRLLPAGHPDIGQSLKNLAGTQHALGDTDTSVVTAREALALYRSTLGEAHPSTLEMGLSLAIKLLAQGNSDEAIALVLPLFEPVPAQGVEPAVVALARFVVAQALWEDEAQQARALDLAQQALAHARQEPEHEVLPLATVEEWLASRQRSTLAPNRSD
jgi:eukaryotic-like serine/threonine-protein kinase